MRLCGVSPGAASIPRDRRGSDRCSSVPHAALRLRWLLGLILMGCASWASSATFWFASTDPDAVRYHSPEEACYLGVMHDYIEADRPTQPPTAQYRILGSSVNAYGNGDYLCHGVMHVRSGPGVTQWTLLLFVGDALIIGSPDSCNIPNYTDPITGQCGPPKCTDDCCGSCANGSNPIHSASGNKHQTETDYVGTGSFPLRFERTYNSNRAVEKAAAPLGSGWTHNYRSHIVGTGGGNPFLHAVAYRPDGRMLTFHKVGSVWQGDPDVSEKLSLATDGTGMPIWTLTTDEDTKETYDGIGLLQSITNRDGLTQTLSYIDSTGQNTGRVQKVTDPEGRTLTFAYNGSDQLVSVTDGNGEVISYGYTAGNLTSASYPDDSGTPKTRTYFYNESGQTSGVSLPHALTGIRDENLDRYASWGYTSAGRANVSVHGPFSGGTIDRTSLIFNSNGTTSVTDALGQSRTFGFDVQYLVARTDSIDQPCDYCAGAAKSRTYDSNGYPASARDFRDTDTTYTFDSRGLETQRIEASTIPDPNNPSVRITPDEKRTIDTVWNATFRVPDRRTVKDRNGVIEARTDWVYNSRGQATARCAYDLTQSGASSYVCSTTGTPPAGIRRWVFTWCDAVNGTDCPLVGLLKSADGPRTTPSDVTTYAYRMADDNDNPPEYRKGDLWKVTDALGHVTEYQERDGNGRPTRIADANGVITTLTYHPRGWIATRTAEGVPGINGGADATTTFDYDDVGNLVKITRPDGAFLAYEYDVAHRLDRITDNLGNHVEYTLDDMGNRLEEKTFAAGNPTTPTRLLSRSYDLLNRLTDQYDAQLRDTQFEYDGNGNRIGQVDPTTVETHSVFDPLNRLKSTVQDYQGTDPVTADATTSYAYDTRDNLREVIDPDSLATSYTFDGVDNLDTLDSPDTGVTIYDQDAAGNRKEQLDARGVVNGFGYDALNRLTGIKYGSAGDVNYKHDEANGITNCPISYPEGRLTRMIDFTGTTTWCYDHRGNVIRKTQVTDGVTYVVSYEYNLADRLMAIDYPDGVRVEYTRDVLGRINAVKVRPTSGGTLTSVISSVTYRPFGPAADYVFATGGQSLALEYDQNYWLTDVSGSVLDLHFCRDGVGNVTRLKATAAACTGTALEQYDYDALYRLTDVETGGGAQIEGYTYSQTGDRLSKTQSGATTPYGYPNPFTSHRLLAAGFDNRGYDANGNMTSSSVLGFFTYDERNRLVTNVRPRVGTTTYDYNGRGERVVKNGSLRSAHFVYDESGLLLTDNGNSNPHPTDYVYADGRPVALVRNGAIYYVHSDQLGTPRAVTTAGSAIPIWTWAFEGNPFGELAPSGFLSMNLRLPGQYYDSETGLHYNYFRDYDPGTGRYVESDPIGLSSGPTTYAYVASSPLSSIDPKGLLTIDCPDCDQRKYQETKKSADRWCAWASQGSHIKDIAIRNCVKKSCRNGSISCKSDCTRRTRCGRDVGIPRGYFNPGEGPVICLNQSAAAGGRGSTAIHEIAHSCGWRHGDGGGVPNDPGVDPPCQ
jgi:RHS repeat-associated protein